MHYITFKTAAFNYYKLVSVMPDPSGVQSDGRSIIASYYFETRMIGWKQYMRLAQIRKHIDTILGGHVTWLYDEIPCDDTIYTIDDFYRRYITFEAWPKWVWPRHRKELMEKGMRYARSLYHAKLLYFEAVLGALMKMNKRMKGRIEKFEKLEEKAKWIMAKAHEQIESGAWQRLQGEELSAARREAGSKGGKASGQTRKSKTEARRAKVKALLDGGMTYPPTIAALVGASKRTIYNDIKAIKDAS